MSADDLLARLAAALDEDECIARTAAESFVAEGRRPDWHEQWSGSLNTGDELHILNDSTVSRYVERFDPARVLRQTAALRQALADARDPNGFKAYDSYDLDYTSFRQGVEAASELFVRALAGIYTEPTDERSGS